jgi:predicted outer membrane lipoprotein
MVQGRLFRAINVYLLLAGCMSLAMIFAPLAFASNFHDNVHASIYGSWITIEHEMVEGANQIEWLAFYKLPFNLVYSLVSLSCGFYLLAAMFYNHDDQQKRKRVLRAFIFVFFQLVFAVVLRLLARQFVGTSPDARDMESGFQREFYLHLFSLYFIYRCSRKLGTLLAKRRVDHAIVVE